MEQRQNRLLLMLALAFFVLLLAHAVSPEARLQQSRDVAIWSLDDDVISVELRRPSEEPIELRRSTSGWRMVAPRQASAAPQVVQDLVTQLSRTTTGELVDVTASTAGVGLNPPAAQVELGMSDGSTVSLKIGERAPVGLRTYIQRGDDAEVFVVRGDLGSAVTAPLESLIQRRAFPDVGVSDIRQLSWRDGHAAPTVLSWRDGNWWIGEVAASDKRVNDLLNVVLGLDLASVEPAVPSPATWSSEIKIITAERSWVLSIGPAGQGEQGHRLVKTPAGEEAWMDEGSLAVVLRRGVTELRDPFAFGMDVEAAQQVSAKLGTWSLHATRQGALWTSEGHEPAVVTDWVRSLAEIRARYDVASSGLRRDRWGVVTVVGERETRTFEVSPPDGTGFVHVRRQGHPASVAISEYALQAAINL